MKAEYFIVVIILLVMLLKGLKSILPQWLPKQPIENDKSHLYYKDRFGVYIYRPRNTGFLGLIGPDLRLFRYKRIAEADPQTFEIVLQGNGTGEILGKDKDFIFYGGRIVSGGDVASLRVFENFAKDRKYVYFRDLIINNLDTETFQYIGWDLIGDKNGLYVPHSSQPRKIDLIDRETFEILPKPQLRDNKYYVGEDKNFNFYSSGGTLRIDPKVGLENFKKLGCGYYLFQEKIFYSVYQLAEADTATFRVLDAPEDAGSDYCQYFYAIDKNYRWLFSNRVSPSNSQDNHQIDILLAPFEDKKKMAKNVFNQVCVPAPAGDIACFGYWNGSKDSSQPGTVRVTQYMDAGILEADLLDSEGKWHKLPSTSEHVYFSTCSEIHVNKFYDHEKKAWFEHRNLSGVSFSISHNGSNPLFVIADNRYSVKLAFSYESLASMLKNKLKDSPVEYKYVGAGGFADKYFLNKENLPEIWIPLQIKDVPIVHIEEQDFIYVGFVYINNQWQCLDNQHCLKFGIRNN